MSLPSPDRLTRDPAAAGTAAQPRRRRWAAVAVAALLATVPAWAGPPGPLLQQLSDETQQVYARARLGMVRVRLPTPRWLAVQNQQLLAKWGARLDPAVRDRVLHAHAARPTTGPAAPPGLGWPATRPGWAITVVAIPDRVLVATGLLLDAKGFAVFPLYVDRLDLGNGASLPALTGDGRPTVAAFVGSDPTTNLTVFKLADPGGGHPAPLAAAAGPPADGSLALVVSPDGSAHLTVWTAASADTGLVLRPDGTFAGFGFADDFLPVETARPVVDQLVATGTVRRPSLGVRGWPVRRSDLFGEDVGSGGPAAIEVTAVEPRSVADRAGVRPGDVILAVGGQPVGPRTFAAAIAARRGPTPLRVRRGAVTADLSVDLQGE